MKDGNSNEEGFNLTSSLKGVVDKIFKLEAGEEDEELECCFKVLIFDDYVFNIICPLLKLYTLREYNITLHMNIKEKKERIPDVMAIYFVRPTKENFKIIQKDVNDRTFENNYINFAESCDDSTLQSFFSDLFQTNNYGRIYKIAVHPIGFFLYHKNIFSLDVKNPYAFLNSPNVKEEDTEKYFHDVGNGIFNTLFTMKSVPIIKYRTGWFAENIVKVITDNFTKTFDKFPELKEEFPRKNNSLLIILDRDTDLPIMLHHGCSLGSLIHDNFGVIRNSSKNSKSLEIDPINDYIWNNYIAADFDSAREKVNSDLRKLLDEVKFLEDMNAPKDMDKLAEDSERLASTIEGLRDKSITNKILQNYTDFSLKLVEYLDTKKLAQFWEIEESLLRERGVNNKSKKTFFDAMLLKSFTVKDISISKIDFLRTALIYFLINQKISLEEVKEIEKILTNYGQNLDAIEYLKNKKTEEEAMKKGTRINQDLGFFSKSVSFLKSRVGSLMSVEQPSIVADLVGSLSGGAMIENFVSYNIIKKAVDKTPTANVTQAIVFIVGGGSLSEYEYVEKITSKTGINIIYGCDYLYRPNEFLSELETLRQFIK